MGFFKSSQGDHDYRAARRELDEQHDREAKALRRGDEAATKRNLDLQRKVVDAEKGASRGAKFWR